MKRTLRQNMFDRNETGIAAEYQFGLFICVQYAHHVQRVENMRRYAVNLKSPNDSTWVFSLHFFVVCAKYTQSAIVIRRVSSCIQ